MNDDGVPVFELPGDDEELLVALDQLREAVVAHPVAARAMFAALAREGRRYASTPAGSELVERLARSRRFARARHAWQASTSWLLTGADASATVPSTLLDALFVASGRDDLATLLEASVRGGRR